MVQQVERNLDDFVGIAAAEQADAELMQREEVLVALVVLQQREAHVVGHTLGDDAVANDRLRMLLPGGFAVRIKLLAVDEFRRADLPSFSRYPDELA